MKRLSRLQRFRSLARRPTVVDVAVQLGDGGRPSPIVARDGTRGILRVGLRRRWRDDLYHRALTLGWPAFLLTATGVFLVANLGFAGLYMLQPGAIANAQPGSFLDAFFFSIETFATIGYGVLSPATTYANTLMTVEAISGIMLVALMTGLMFARVSRPTARVLFSRVAVISAYDGIPTLMVRTGNERRSQILAAEVAMTLVRNERSAEGQTMRRFHTLALARDRTPIFAMSFLIMHRLDDASPLRDATADSLDAEQAEILVTVTGIDERMGQMVHARTSYMPHEILFGHRYADIFGVTEDGRRAIDYRRFHHAEPV